VAERPSGRTDPRRLTEGKAGMTVPTTGLEAPPAEVGPSTRRERVGWYFYDWANSAFATTVIAVFLAPYLTEIAKDAANCATDAACGAARLYPLGIPVSPLSYYSYTLSLSVILQVLVLPITGAFTDRSRHRRVLLAIFAYIGSAATIGFLFLSGDRYLLGGGLFVLANVAFGASIVVYNSFLPQLSGPDQRDSVSSIGWAFGYIGGGLLLVINLIAYTSASEDTTGLIVRWSLASAGIWWALFTTLPLALLKDPPPQHAVRSGSALTGGFRQLGQTLKGLKAYPLTLFFLIAFLVYNDGIQTVIGVAGQYASDYLKLEDTTRIVTILIVQFTAFGGALLLGFVAKKVGAWKTVLASLVLWTLVVIAAYFLPVGQATPFLILGVALGIVLGGSQALSRSLFSQLIPKGKEGEYFGFYEISDKGTSWMGPLVFGLSLQMTGNYQIAIVSIVLFFVIGFVALLAIPMRRAIVAAGNTPPRIL
jgi:MFS transporter, UMF1 family